MRRCKTLLGLHSWGSLAVPPILCLMAADWLSKQFGLGEWVFLAAVVLGIGGAASTFAGFARMFVRRNGKK